MQKKVLTTGEEIQGENTNWFKNHFDTDNNNFKLTKNNNKIIRITKNEL